MKTAVSIPDEIFNAADELAKLRGMSRSELYRRALAEYLTSHRSGAVTEALNSVADELKGDSSGFTARAAGEILQRSEW